MIETARYSESHLYAVIKPGFNLADVERRFRWNERHNVDWFIYKTTGAVLGWVNVNWNGMNDDGICPEIFDLYVMAGHRSRGMGTALLGFCELEALARGFPRIGLCVNPVINSRAMSLYARSGYIKAGKLFPNGACDGIEDWTIAMKKPL
ncbi:GNAT family N-acetyltransferase [bacterium]|nr:GNAT family N-acetyltransferase [candidate division CSSED10-310 bacterium]